MHLFYFFFFFFYIFVVVVLLVVLVSFLWWGSFFLFLLLLLLIFNTAVFTFSIAAGDTCLFAFARLETSQKLSFAVTNLAPLPIPTAPCTLLCSVPFLVELHFIYVIGNLQVCFNGVNEANGKSVENALQKVYGADSVMFVKCDVSKEEEFKGYVNYLIHHENIPIYFLTHLNHIFI